MTLKKYRPREAPDSFPKHAPGADGASGATAFSV